MRIHSEYQDFLSNIKRCAAHYQSIIVNGKLDELPHPFWTFAEIKNSLSMRQDWDVDANLIPFYGNWHDLMCVNQQTGAVIVLDDDRNVLASWPDTATFMQQLSKEEVVYAALTDANIVSVWLKPGFADKFIKNK